MGLTDEEKLERTNFIRDNIRITKGADNKPFIFVSYKSDDWEIVFKKVIKRLQDEYSLRIYCDRDFETNNDEWLDTMKAQIRSGFCRGILAFFSESYISSYATLLEILTAQTDETADYTMNENVVEIIPVYLGGCDSFAKYRERIIPLLSNKCGIKKTEWDSFQECFTEGFTKSELNLRELEKIQKGDDLIVKNVVKTFRDNEDTIAKNKNKYIDSESFVSNLYATIKSVDEKVSDGGESVFGEPSSKKTEQKPQTPEPSRASQKDIPVPEADDRKADEPVAVVKPQRSMRGRRGDDVAYWVYGEKHSGDQSDMMFDTFEAVLKKHSDILDSAVSQCTCLAYEEGLVRPDKTPVTYFRVKREIEVSGKKVYIGASYSLGDKMSQIARVIDLSGDDTDSVLKIDSDDGRFVIPQKRKKADAIIKEPTNMGETSRRGRRGDEIEYYVYGTKHVGDQASMMYDTIEAVLKKHPEILDTAIEKCTCLAYRDGLSKSDGSPVTYFSVKTQISVNGKDVFIGASYGLAAKIAQVTKVANLAGENIRDILKINSNDPKYIF